MKIEVHKFDYGSDQIIHALAESEKKDLLREAEILIFRKGQLIFYEGGVPTGVFIIENGRAKIFKTGMDGKDQIFYIYNHGDILGYHALLCDEKYEDSCEAIEDCKVLFISKVRFDQLLEEIPKLKSILIRNMSHEFGVLVNTITVFAQKPLRERLAIFLLILQNRYRDRDSDEIEITLSREDLANLVGTARESLSRLLKEFRDENLIEIKSRNIRLLDEAKLNRIASSEYL